MTAGRCLGVCSHTHLIPSDCTQHFIVSGAMVDCAFRWPPCKCNARCCGTSLPYLTSCPGLMGEYDRPYNKCDIITHHCPIRHSRVSACTGHTVCHNSAQNVARLVATHPAVDGPMCSNHSWPVARKAMPEHLADVKGQSGLSDYSVLMHAQGMLRFPMSNFLCFAHSRHRAS